MRTGIGRSSLKEFIAIPRKEAAMPQVVDTVMAASTGRRCDFQ
jgi:hypothetical protein